MRVIHKISPEVELPLIVAEISGNHNQSLEYALKMVEAVAETGAHALKLQTYTADTMTLDMNEGEFFINDADSLWFGQTLFELYQKAYTPWEWHKPIMDKARDLGLICFSSPFDETAVDFLECLDVPCYKVASFELTDLPLIRKIASTGKPLIMSTGMATISEISEVVIAAREAGSEEIILLKCTSTYPANPLNTNLLAMPYLRELFKCEVGLSDHTQGIGVAVAAVSFGATLIEKHFTLDRSDGGVDAAFSLEPAELKNLVVETRRASKALGSAYIGPTADEEKARLRRRSLYISEDMKLGDVLTPKNLRKIRPGYGLHPKYYDLLLGKKVNKQVNRGTPLSWDLLLDSD